MPRNEMKYRHRLYKTKRLLKRRNYYQEQISVRICFILLYVGCYRRMTGSSAEISNSVWCYDPRPSICTTHEPLRHNDSQRQAMFHRIRDVGYQCR